MKGRLAAAATALMSAAPTFVLAADEGHGGGQVSIFAGGPGNAIWTLVIFLLLVAVLGKFAWGPILRNLKAREDFIRDSIEQARKDREQAEKVLRDYQAQLAAARQEASGLIAQGRQQAEAVKSEIIKQAKAEGDQMIARAKGEIGLARDQAIQDVYDRTAELATEVAGKILARQLRPEDHRDLVQKSLEQLGQAETSRN